MVPILLSSSSLPNPTEAITESNSGTVFVQSAYARPDLRDPAALAFTVTIDGNRVGAVPPQGSWAFQVSPGSHEVRVGLMWFKSPRLSVVVPAGGQVVLRADVNGKVNSPSLLVRGIVAPSKAPRLEQIP